MPRKRLEPGQYGKVSVKRDELGNYRARCWYRDMAGHRHQIDLVRSTERAAVEAAKGLAREKGLRFADTSAGVKTLRRDKQWWLYRMFDAEGRLLYIGVTEQGIRRWLQHQQRKPWFADVRAWTVEVMPDGDTARAAEREAIASESPRHNVQGRLTAA